MAQNQLNCARRRTESFCLSVLLLMAFGVRLGGIVALTGLNTPPNPGSDEKEYDSVAWNLATGQGYVGISPDVVDSQGQLLVHPTAYRPPPPTFQYAAVYYLFGHQYAAAYILNCIVATGTVLLIFLIGKRLFGDSSAWLAAVVYAFYPIAVYYNLTLNSETQAAFLLCLYVWLSLRVIDGPKPRWQAFGAGAALGVLLLSKPGFIFLIPMLGIWAVIICHRQREFWFRVVLIPVVAGLVILPWAARNYAEFGKLIPFSTGGGSLLLQANNRLVMADPNYFGYAVWDTSLPEYAEAIKATNNEIERDAVAKKFGMDWLKANPDKWFYLARGKLWRLWTPSYQGSGNRNTALVITFYYGSILLAFVATVIPVSLTWFRQRHTATLMLFLIAATMVMAAIFHGQHRYRYPVDSLCILIAAHGVASLVRTIRAGNLTQSIRENIAQPTFKFVAALLFVGLVGWYTACYFDQQKIDAYRQQLVQERIDSIEHAVREYQKKYQRLPDRLEVLVPEFLPNVESLHAPGVTLEYPDYQKLPSKDASKHPQIVCFEIVSTSEGSFEIRQTKGVK